MRNLTSIILLVLLSITHNLKAQEKDNSENNSLFTPGYSGSVELGFLYGKTENAWNTTYLASPSITIFNGYRTNRLFTIGGVTGFDFYENILIIPIGLGVRGTLLNSRISPTYSIDAGYGSSFLSGKAGVNDIKGGWFFNPALGISVVVGNKSAFIFGIGYKNQPVEIDLEGWGTIINQKMNYRRLTARMGLMF